MWPGWTCATSARRTPRGHPPSRTGAVPSGCLKALDGQPLGFADFGGNRQDLTVGYLSENPKAFRFLIDYAYRVEDDPPVRRGQTERTDAMVPREHAHDQRL